MQTALRPRVGVLSGPSSSSAGCGRAPPSVALRARRVAASGVSSDSANPGASGTSPSGGPQRRVSCSAQSRRNSVNAGAFPALSDAEAAERVAREVWESDRDIEIITDAAVGQMRQRLEAQHKIEVDLDEVDALLSEAQSLTQEIEALDLELAVEPTVEDAAVDDRRSAAAAKRAARRAARREEEQAIASAQVAEEATTTPSSPSPSGRGSRAASSAGPISRASPRRARTTTSTAEASTSAPSGGLVASNRQRREARVAGTRSAGRGRRSKVAVKAAASADSATGARGLSSRRASRSGATQGRTAELGKHSSRRRGAEADNALGGLGTHDLLSAEEEVTLARQVQDLLKLEAIQEELREQLGREPHVAEWAEAAGAASDAAGEAEFRHRLTHGGAAKKRMVESNLRLVVSIAKRYMGRGLPVQDLVSEGILGLMRGVEKFDPEKGFKFSTYAHWWIRQAVTRSLAEQGRVIRLPVHMHEIYSKVQRTERDMRQSLNRDPTDAEVSEAVGITEAKLHKLRMAHRNPASINAPLAKNDPEASTLEDMIEDEGQLTPEESAIAQLLRDDLDAVLHTLTEREYGVLELRYGLKDGNERTLEEIGKAFGVTRERIRQIEAKAMRKLRQPARHSVLLEYTDHATAQSQAPGARAGRVRGGK